MTVLLFVSCSGDDDAIGPVDNKPEVEEIPESVPPEQAPTGFTPCENGTAGGYPCNGIDFLGRVSIEDFGSRSGNDVWGWVDAQTDKEYAIMGLDDGTAFIDISDTENLRYLGKLPTATVADVWRDVKVYQDHAFIVADNSVNNDAHGVQVFDLTRLRDVVDIPATFDADARYTGLGRAHNIVINEDSGFAYVVGTNRGDAFNGGAHFIDVNDPKNPVAAGGYADNGYSHDAQVVTYTGPDADYSNREIFIGANEDQVVIVDVTDKQNPVPISSLSYDRVTYTHQGWFTEDQRYFILGDELDEANEGFNTRTLIFDLADLDNPVLHHTYFSDFTAIDHNGYVKGDEFYLANYSAGIRILDISAIANREVVETAFFDTYPQNNSVDFNGVWSVYPYLPSGKIIVSDITSGLFVLQKQE